jgi:glycosyltransferase involved in cell wall biosynthesis
MAVLAIVTSSPPAAEGGHIVIARALVEAAKTEGHDARLVLTPECTFGRQHDAYRAARHTDVAWADQVISLRFPSYAVRHRAHVCWLNHTMREYYDLWPQFSAGLSARARVKERIKRAIQRAADRRLLRRNVTEVVAQSRTIQKRLAADLGVEADVLRPPPPQRAYRCDAYGPSILAVSRLSPHKRIDLLIRALAEPAARDVRLVVAGDGAERGPLEALSAELHVVPRVEFVGHADENTLLRLYAECRAVCFPPLAEDYGFVTVEAFSSAKAVVTCRDSGGPTELVRDGENGFVCDPTPASLASALARLSTDAALAERLGRAAGAAITGMTWQAAVKRLVIVQ